MRKLLTFFALLLVLRPGLASAADPSNPALQSQPGAFAYLVTNADSDYVTELHIVNLASGQLFVSGRLYDTNGLPMGQQDIALVDEGIAQEGHLTLRATDLETLFGTPTWQGPALLTLTGSGEFEVMTQLVNPGGLTTSTACVARDSIHLLPGSDSHTRLFIRLVNQGDEAITNIQGTLSGDNGIIGERRSSLSASLAPFGAIFINGSELADLFSPWLGTASLFVTADNPENLRLMALAWQDGTFVNFSCSQRAIETAKPASCDDPRPEACVQVYDPVCGARDTGIRCITTPCDSLEWATYSNGCSACSDPLVYRYLEGSCESLLEGE